MKTKELVELVRSGVKPIIKVKDDNQVLEDGPEPGMLGRIISVGAEDIWERGTSTIPFTIDFFEFTEYNKSFATPTFFNKFGSPSITWMETPGYEKEAKTYLIYEMYIEGFEYSDFKLFELAEQNKWISEFLSSNTEMGYVQWLENKLDELIKSK